MPDHGSRCFIGLQQGEGRAWDIDILPRQRPDKATCQHGLSGPKVTDQRDDIAGPGQCSQISTQICGVRFSKEQA